MHASPDVLALLALGEVAGDEADTQHLQSCLTCRGELAELRRTVDVGRRTTAEDTMHEPHARVWAAVRQELGFDAPLAPVTPLAPVATESSGGGAGTRRRFRSQRLVSLALAAVVALVAGFGLGLGWNRLTQPSAVQATMNALPRWPGSTGTASIETQSDGSKVLVISVQTPETSPDKQEVWLSDVEAQHMLSVGYLDHGTGRFVLPASVNLRQRPVVDVSAEPPNDTNPDHSGNSIVRCRLPV